MRKVLLFLLSLPLVLVAQQRVLGPYLQNAEPTSIVVMWETSFATNSRLSYGLSPSLGSVANGNSAAGFLLSKIHTVKINDLQPNTHYYYSVNFGGSYSDTILFKTPPLPDSEQSFGMVAFSDMQKDASQSNKFNEIVEEGVIDYTDLLEGATLPDKLAFLLVPGDLVDIGWIYSSWKDEFFEPAQNLFEMVPVYPVLGNHEANTAFFFSYFDLPENGYVGFKDHWWYKDYSNTRIIGLNSNVDFIALNGGKQKQLDWLTQVLEDACADENIDFVFAQMHHPFHSEMWIPGEEPYIGDVIKLLEEFSTNCDKPSIHFYGHTHSYARGQSKDHKHLMVNVASAGGALDKWDSDDRDYEEFSKGISDYGFVYLEVEASVEPKFTLKRISRGSGGNIVDNEVRDSIVIYKNDYKPTKPVSIKPLETSVSTDCIVLEANLFQSDEAATQHGESQWQVATHCDSFDTPVVDIWKNYENWYFDENLQAGDDLTDQEISGLAGNSNYCWRVRYRDRNLRWSDWSEPAAFTTKKSINLLKNSGAELGIEDWVVTQGAMESLTTGECNGISPFKGNRYFVVGAACQFYANAKAHQIVDISYYAEKIDAGAETVYFGAHLSDFNGTDKPEFRLTFLDESENTLGQTAKIGHQQPFWKAFDEEAAIPPFTRKIKFELFGTRGLLGQANDSYFDELYLIIDSTQGRIDTAICAGETLSIFGTELTESGTYILEDDESEDCLNQYEVNLTVLDTQYITLNETICEGDSIQFGELYYFETGNYTLNFLNQSNCDSIITLQLEVLSPDASECVTGIRDNLSNNVAVYPNPFTSETIISLKSNPKSNSVLKVFNDVGEMVMEMEQLQTKEIKINRGNLIAGVYFFAIESNQTIDARGSFIIKD
jgi:3',5'-cyclic AMP phosphodiesterase CpdA